MEEEEEFLKIFPCKIQQINQSESGSDIHQSSRLLFMRCLSHFLFAPWFIYLRVALLFININFTIVWRGKKMLFFLNFSRKIRLLRVS